MRWRLICEEYGPKLVYLKGEKNIVADVLSQLHLEPTPKSQCNASVLDIPDVRQLAESFLGEGNFDDLPKWTIPVSYRLLYREQRKDKLLQQKYTLNKNKNYRIKSFSADSNTVRKLIMYKDKIYVPKTLEKRMVQWYHAVLNK